MIIGKSKISGAMHWKNKSKVFRKGKYGRILGIPYTEDGKDICKILIKEGHAVAYDGCKKTKIWGEH